MRKIPLALGSGFTLIELMIVVAIIGILVAIAAPNFAKYQAKSRQAEAKLSLGAVFTGEKAFNGEYSSYVAGMADVGYSPEGNKRFYTIGWTAVTNSGSVTGYGADPSIPNYTRVNYPAGWNTCTPAGLSTSPAAATLDSQVFSVTTTGQISMAGTTCDTWTIDEQRTLQNTTVGL